MWYWSALTWEWFPPPAFSPPLFQGYSPLWDHCHSQTPSPLPPPVLPAPPSPQGATGPLWAFHDTPYRLTASPFTTLRTALRHCPPRHPAALYCPAALYVPAPHDTWRRFTAAARSWRAAAALCGRCAMSFYDAFRGFFGFPGRGRYRARPRHTPPTSRYPPPLSRSERRAPQAPGPAVRSAVGRRRGGGGGSRGPRRAAPPR